MQKEMERIKNQDCFKERQKVFSGYALLRDQELPHTREVNILGILDRAKQVMKKKREYSKYKMAKDHPDLAYTLTGKRVTESEDAEYASKYKEDQLKKEERKKKLKVVVAKGTSALGNAVKETAKGFDEGYNGKKARKPKKPPSEYELGRGPI